jgi:hypothetical protein
MGTPLKTSTVIGTKVSSVLVVSVTVRVDGAVLADWQGLDDKGQGVVRQVAAFPPDIAKELLSGAVSELIGKVEAAIVSAIASSGQAPPKDLPVELVSGPMSESVRNAPAALARIEAIRKAQAASPKGIPSAEAVAARKVQDEANAAKP